MEQLKACYERYVAQAETVCKNRPDWDGVIGLGSVIKDHPCHRAFYGEVQAWVESFLKNAPDRETAEAAVTYVLQASENAKGQVTCGTMQAAHGLVKPLICLVSPQFAGRTRIAYETNIRRVDRLPVQKELLKLLKKREKES